MAPGPESKLVAAIKKAVLAAYPGAFVHKEHGSAYSSGMPDLLIIVNGVTVFIEVKAPREGESDASVLSRVTPLQNETMKKLRAAGACAEPAWSVDQVLEILDRYVPKTVNREDRSRDARLYSLADAEDKLRKQMEALEQEAYEMRVELDRYRSNRA